jgi:hypothetical protein
MMSSYFLSCLIALLALVSIAVKFDLFHFGQFYSCCPLGMSIDRDILSFSDVMILIDVSGRHSAPSLHRFKPSCLLVTWELLTRTCFRHCFIGTWT